MKKHQKIKFQPHCHQRAQGLANDGLSSGANATVGLLSSCGYDVELLDTGCCGMAGTFGYESEHYDLSMEVGRLKLFPALHDSTSGSNENYIVGTGAACRMQITQGGGMKARHPIELIRDVLVPSAR